jgi:hypothetical protein
VSATRLSEEPVAPSAVRGSSREAGRRIALFVLVLLVAGGAAFGAGKLLSAGMTPAEMSGHDMSGHTMSDMPGMDTTGTGR